MKTPFGNMESKATFGYVTLYFNKPNVYECCKVMPNKNKEIDVILRTENGWYEKENMSAIIFLFSEFFAKDFVTWHTNILINKLPTIFEHFTGCFVIPTKLTSVQKWEKESFKDKWVETKCEFFDQYQYKVTVAFENDVEKGVKCYLVPRNVYAEKSGKFFTCEDNIFGEIAL